MTTIFQKIITGEIPADIVYDDDTYIAIRDINPQAPIHLLIIPKQLITNFHTAHTLGDIDANKATIRGLWDVAWKLIDQLSLDGCQLHMNSGANHGQTVHHLHLHLLSQGSSANDGNPYRA